VISRCNKFSGGTGDSGGGTGGANPAHEFSPYIDMAITADDDLMAISHASGIENFTLAFVLASDKGIGWQGQGAITDDTLANGTTILSQVEAVQAAGGHITISFGGAAGQEAALTAPNATTLQSEYQSVIDRYHVNSIDFDIEGAAVADQHSITLRDQALVGLEQANPNLEVSYTLPVLPTGLVASGLNVLQSAIHDGVKINTVNIMTMDYGTAVDNNGQMGTDAIDAIKATEQQLSNLGINPQIGVTPMIGVNDISSEVFKLPDAQQLVNYAQTDSHVAEVSMWSVARDNGSTAGQNYDSPTGSGVAQQPYAYSAIFHQFDVHA
jgi:Glycosyl hydrolases family 18